MSNSSEDGSKGSFRSVNQTLGMPLGVGPVPGNQFLYWALIFFVTWFVCDRIFGAGLYLSAIIAGWLILAWTLLTGREPWKFLADLVVIPWWGLGGWTYRPLISSRVDLDNNS